MGDGLGDVIHGCSLGKRLDLLDDGAQGQRHVGAGVAVGDGEDVELVDLVGLVRDDLGGHGEAVTNDVGNHDLVDLGSLRGCGRGRRAGA